jgi:hypothetical protein
MSCGQIFPGDLASVQETEDGGYIAAGETGLGTSAIAAWLIRTDADGNELWNKPLERFGYNIANSVQETEDGGYIIAGYTGAPGKLDAWLIRTDADGNEMWNETFGGPKHDIFHSVQQTENGGYIIAGETISFGINQDAWLIKVCPEEVYPKELCSGKSCQDYEPKRDRCCSEREYPGHSIVY